MAVQHTAGSPLWWVSKLYQRLEERRPKLQTYDDYYEGRHALNFTTSKYRESFGPMFDGFADNWCDLVVDAVEERLNIQGFRFGDRTGDETAWRIWQANQCDNQSGLTHTEALVSGTSYASVWFNPDDENTPRITMEHPAQTIVAYSPADPLHRLAALKCFADDEGYQRATLYLPWEIHRFRSARVVTDFASTNRDVWTPFTTLDQDSVEANPLGVVPIVPVTNRPRLLKYGFSELDRVIPIQDAINKLVADMLVASEYGAAPQRWATGITVPKDPVTKEEMPIFKDIVARLLHSPDPNSSFGQFPQTDLVPFVRGVEMLVQHIASQTRTPPHYFYLSGQFPSGESIKSAETGLVAKVVRRQGGFGESWEEVQRLAFLVLGDEARANNAACETIWGDPESRSESEHVDAIMKKQALGIENELLWEELGMSPQLIQRNKDLKAQAARAPAGPTSPEEMTYAERLSALSEYVRAGFDPADATEKLGLPPVVHTGHLPVSVQA